MCRTSCIRKDGMGNSVDELLGETCNACNILRQELDAMRSIRTKTISSRRKEIELLEFQYRFLEEKLQRKLPEHANIAAYRQFLRHYELGIGESEENNGGDGTAPIDICINRARTTNFVTPSSNYIIQQQTPLLSTIHRSFCVLPHQIELFEIYEREIYGFFREEIQSLQRDSLETSDYWMSRLSRQAEDNDSLYESYRIELQSIEKEVKMYRGLLLHQNANSNQNNKSDGNRNECSESETDLGSDIKLSAQQKVCGGFVTEALFLLNPMTRQEVTTPSIAISISDVFHDPIWKVGAFFQIVTNSDT